MSDGKRYTQQHLYDDIPELDDHTPDWIRKRISHLHQNALIDKVGTSSMYQINEVGISALELEDELREGEFTPREIGQRIREHAGNDPVA